MWLLLGLENPLPQTPAQGITAALAMIATGVGTWLATKGYGQYQQWRKDRIENAAKEAENKQKEKLAEQAIREKEIELRQKEERGEIDLDSLKESKVIESYKYLLEKERMEKDAARQEHKEEVASLVAEMRQMRKEHQAEIATARADHEQCLQDRAAGNARIEALEKRVSELTERYENLKKRVGGSDIVIDLGGTSTELMPDKHERRHKPPRPGA